MINGYIICGPPFVNLNNFSKFVNSRYDYYIQKYFDLVWKTVIFKTYKIAYYNFISRAKLGWGGGASKSIKNKSYTKVQFLKSHFA